MKAETDYLEADWWKKYIPMEGETFSDFIERVGDYIEQNLVLLQTDAADLVTVAQAYRINRFRFAFKEGCYTVLVLRDIVFANYTLEWEMEVA
jgi:hypothetical protein